MMFLQRQNFILSCIEQGNFCYQGPTSATEIENVVSENILPLVRRIFKTNPNPANLEEFRSVRTMIKAVQTVCQSLEQKLKDEYTTLNNISEAFAIFPVILFLIN